MNNKRTGGEVKVRRIARFCAVAFGGSTVVAFGAYAVVVPQHDVEAYSVRVSSGAQALHREFTALETTTQRGVFDDPDTLPLTRLDDLQAIETQLASARAAVDTYRRQVESYEKAQYTSFTGRYDQADRMKQDVDDMTAQSLEVMQQYEEVVGFLIAASQAQQAIEEKLASVNAIVDFNELAGRHDDIYAWARQVREARAAFEAVQAPPEYASVRQGILDRSSQLAGGLEGIAYGLYTAIDSYIYGAAQEVERTTVAYESSDRQLVFSSSQSSQVLRNVSELSDKLDILEEAAVTQ